jgi:predicted enzyme related to lactoylglutathione lyase
MAETAVRGRFVWQELMTTDVQSAVAYYQKVVGWKTQAWQVDSNYLMWVAKSGPIGGVAALPAVDAAPYWLHYIGTADIDATVRDAEQLGGHIVVPITNIANGGRYAVLADPQGGKFGVHWSAGATTPVGQPQSGEFAWYELATSDYQAAFNFYQALFGWQKTDQLDMGEVGVYFMFGINGQSIGGIYNKRSDTTVSWCGYALVADAVKAAKLAAKSGGKVCNGPMQVPGGNWIAQLSDPQGAMHAVVSPTPASAKAAVAQAAAKKGVKKKASKSKSVKKKTTIAKSKQAAVATRSTNKAVKKPAAKKKVVKKSLKRPAAKQHVIKKKLVKKKIAAKKLRRFSRAKAVNETVKKRAKPKRRIVAKRKK